jgi:ribonuclease P protein component
MKKENSLKKSYEFESIISKRKSVGCSSLAIYYQNNNYGYARVGISCGKRIGNAVVRNRTKRQVRSLLDQHLDYKTSRDYIVIVRNKFLEQNFENNNRDIKYLLEKINKLNKEK